MNTVVAPLTIIFATIRRNQKRFDLVSLLGNRPCFATIVFLVIICGQCDAMRFDAAGVGTDWCDGEMDGAAELYQIEH